MGSAIGRWDWYSSVGQLRTRLAIAVFVRGRLQQHRKLWLLEGDDMEPDNHANATPNNESDNKPDTRTNSESHAWTDDESNSRSNKRPCKRSYSITNSSAVTHSDARSHAKPYDKPDFGPYH